MRLRLPIVVFVSLLCLGGGCGGDDIQFPGSSGTPTSTPTPGSPTATPTETV